MKTWDKNILLKKNTVQKTEDNPSLHPGSVLYQAKVEIHK